MRVQKGSRLCLAGSDFTQDHNRCQGSGILLHDDSCAADKIGTAIVIRNLINGVRLHVIMRNADVIDQQRCILHQKVNIYISNAIDSNVSGIHGVNKTVYLIFQPEAGIGKKGSKILLHLIKESSSGGAPFHTGKIRLTILGINKQCFTALDNCSF